MVYETERRSLRSTASAALTSDDLPAPDGAAMINSIPRNMLMIVLLEILDLLANLLDRQLEFDGRLRKFAGH